MYMTLALDAHNGYVFVDVLFNDEELVCYRIVGDEDWQIPNACNSFFGTEEEVRRYLADRVRDLQEKRISVSDMLTEVYMYHDTQPHANHAVDVLDFIPYCVQQRILEETAETCAILASCIRTRMLTIAGKTISVDDISHIDWGGRKETAVVLNSGVRITVSDWKEEKLLELIYKNNR